MHLCTGLPSVSLICNIVFGLSDELLLEEDSSDRSCLAAEFSKAINLGSTETLAGVRRSVNISKSNSNAFIQR